MSAFDLLNLPYYAHLDEEMLRERFQELSSSSHPDQGGSDAEFKELNQAYQKLRTASGRLRELFELYSIEYSPRGSVSPDLMELFMSTGDIIQRIDTHLKRKQKASSALEKALAETESIKLQQQLGAQIQAVETSIDTTQSTLPQIDRQGVIACQDLAIKTARNLAFLEKWRGQLRERFGQLF